NGEVGHLVYIWAGPARGQFRRIVSNTDHVLTIDVPWDPNATPTSASTFLIVAATWLYLSETSPLVSVNPNPSSAPIIGTVNVANLTGSQLLLGVVTEDATGKLGTQFLMPLREIYIEGNGGSNSTVPPGNVTLVGTPVIRVLPADSQGNILVDISQAYTPPSPL